MIFIFDITLLPPQKPIFHNLSKSISLWSSFWKYKSKSFVEYSWNLMQCFSEFEDRRIWFLTSASIFILIYLNNKSNVSGLQLFKFFTWSYILQKKPIRTLWGNVKERFVTKVISKTKRNFWFGGLSCDGETPFARQ